MKNLVRFSDLSLAAAIAVVGTVPIWGEAALSQVLEIPNAPETEVTPSNESNGAELLRGGLNPVNIIHNANLSRSRNGSEFADDTRRNLQEAADEFKQLQLQRLQDQGASPSPAN